MFHLSAGDHLKEASILSNVLAASMNAIDVIIFPYNAAAVTHASKVQCSILLFINNIPCSGITQFSFGMTIYLLVSSST
jgi:hypothetical protein